MASDASVLVIEPKKSMWLLMLLLVSHTTVVLVTLFLLQGHWLIQVVVLLLIGFSIYYYYRLHITKVLSRSVKLASHHISNGWSIVVMSNHSILEEVAVDLDGSSYRSQWWVVLNFRYIDSRQRYTLLVPADSVSPEIHRQLRVRLKTMG